MSAVTDATPAVNPVRALSRSVRNLDPHFHIDPCYLNVPTCTKHFGYYFTEFFLSRTIKEHNEYAKIFNDHLLVTFVMDACRDEEVRTLGAVLADPVPGQLFCSTELLQGADAVSGTARARNRVLLPYASPWDSFVEFDPHHFLSDTERAAHAHQALVSLICHVDVVRDGLMSATAFVMGAPGFTHFRNHDEMLDLDDHAMDWFETWPEDIDELESCAGIDQPDAAEWRAALAGISAETIYRIFAELLDGAMLESQGGAHSAMIAAGIHRDGVEQPAAVTIITEEGASEPAALRDAMTAMSATPAELWIVQHCHDIGPAVREMVRAFAVSPLTPRRFCLIDGADTYRILKAYGRL